MPCQDAYDIASDYTKYNIFRITTTTTTTIIGMSSSS